MANPIPLEGEFTLLTTDYTNKGLRRARRYRCRLATIGRIRSSDVSALKDAFVLNLSKTGIGLSVTEPLNVGSELSLRLRVPNESAHRQFSLRVIHVTPQADGRWRMGCAFAEPISAELLELLLH